MFFNVYTTTYIVVVVNIWRFFSPDFAKTSNWLWTKLQFFEVKNRLKHPKQRIERQTALGSKDSSIFWCKHFYSTLFPSFSSLYNTLIFSYYASLPPSFKNLQQTLLKFTLKYYIQLSNSLESRLPFLLSLILTLTAPNLPHVQSSTWFWLLFLVVFKSWWWRLYLIYILPCIILQTFVIVKRENLKIWNNYNYTIKL